MRVRGRTTKNWTVSGNPESVVRTLAAIMENIEREFRSDEFLRECIIDGVEDTDVTIGHGSYGRVFEVKFSGTICAAKGLHNSLEHDFAAKKLVTKCRLMAKLRHPQIVQFLGVCFLSSNIPVLVTERLWKDLNSLLEKSTGEIPLYTKCSILRDTASGLAFLHNQSPPIVHCNLTARNVLLNKAFEAKLADFRITQLTDKCVIENPRNTQYMPPEASLQQYGPSLDIFSYGVLALFTLTQQFPLPVTSSGSKTGENKASELQQRHMSMKKLHQISGIGEDHYFVSMITDCLSDNKDDRPSVQDILQNLQVISISKQDQLQLLQSKTKLQQEVETKKLQTHEGGIMVRIR